MSEMIDRVAQALASDLEEGFPRFTQMRWDQLTALARATYRKRARVAIEAMRNPDDVMSAAGRPIDSMALRGVDSIYNAMIDAALK